MNINKRIPHEFPELSKHITEILENDFGIDTGELGSNGLKKYYNSLAEIATQHTKTQMKKKDSDSSNFEGYPLYPPSEDIYSKGKKEMSLNPEDLSKKKAPNEGKSDSNEKDFEDDMSGDDLDIPGSELDDQQESVGSEDEENNYYSLGGDNHNDLEEDKG